MVFGIIAMSATTYSYKYCSEISVSVRKLAFSYVGKGSAVTAESYALLAVIGGRPSLPILDLSHATLTASVVAWLI